MREYMITGRRNQQLLEYTVHVKFKGTAHVETIPRYSTS